MSMDHHHDSSTHSKRQSDKVSFRPFTEQSLQAIAERAEAIKQEKEEEKDKVEADKKKEEEEPEPNAAFEVGKALHPRYGEVPAELIGVPIEDLDDFYDSSYTFMVIAKDKTIFRFSATKSMYLLSPFNPIRRTAIYVLTHPFFSLFVMLVILVNCVFMAINKEIANIEAVFTAIYTTESCIKIVARGFIAGKFHYLRDAWNWLDFIVVALAYLTMGVSLGNLAVLRTFRVLRALKTVAVVPGLKTIVGALLEAVRRLRDVMILSVFVLSIFALVGLQIYSGTLSQKCVLDFDGRENASELELKMHEENETNWYGVDFVCGLNGDAGRCPDGYYCVNVGPNPNYGYTSFDNFGSAMLCAFRLMTQDYWENLYLLVIRANGPWHMLFFIVVILMGSFYLVNVILAIVAMSYDDCRKMDQEQEEAELQEATEEEARLLQEEMASLGYAMDEDGKSPSNASAASIAIYQRAVGQRMDRDRISMKSDYWPDGKRRFSMLYGFSKKASVSLPGSPFSPHRGSGRRMSQFSWKKQNSVKHCGNNGHCRPHTMMPCLDNLDLPFADDSAAVTPTSEELCNLHNTQITAHRRRLSTMSGRLSQLESRFNVVSERSAHLQNQLSPPPSYYAVRHQQDRVSEPTHFHWNTSVKRKKKRPLTELADGRTSLGPKDSTLSFGDYSFKKDKLLEDNPFIVRTPSSTAIDLQDLKVLKSLIRHAAGKKRGCLGYEEGTDKKEFLKEKCMQLLFGWECSPCWYKFSHYIELFILDAFVDMSITLCICINTLFMAMERAGMSTAEENTFKNANYAFTAIFTVEAAFKIIALGLYRYMQDKWNVFDIAIVFLSLIELSLENVKGLSILRSFRLVRFK